MNLQQLYYYRTIAKYKNYTKASNELLVAQSSLSHSISDLETELGVPLFYRVGRNIEVTDYGAVFLKYVDRIIAELESAKQEIQLMLNSNVGRVRLSFGNTLCNHFIPNIINDFYRNPDNRTVQFEFHENQVLKIIDDFKNKKTDLGFGPIIENDEMEFFPIINEEMVVIVSKKNHLASKKVISLNELAGEPIISYSYNCGSRYFIDKIFEKAGIVPNIAHEIENEKMMASLVSADIGVGILPLIPELSVYNVAVLHFDTSDLNRTLYMMWPKHEFMLPVVKNFKDYVIKSVQSNKQI